MKIERYCAPGVYDPPGPDYLIEVEAVAVL
jgi:hypothetical protein